MNDTKRSLTRFGLALALLIALPLGWGIYHGAVGQPVGSDTIVQTDGGPSLAPAFRARGRDTNISINLVPKGTGTVQINGVPLGGSSFATLTVAPGPLAVTGTTNLTGPLFVQTGSAGGLKLVGAVGLFHNTTDVGNGADTTEDVLHTFSVPAGTLAVDGQWLRWTTFINMAANADTKRTRFYFGGTLIGDTTAVAYNNQSFKATCEVYRTSATAQKAFCTVGAVPTTAAAWGAGGTGTTGGYNQSTPAETLSGAVVMQVTGTSGAATANNIIAKTTVLQWYPQGQ